MGLFGPDDDYIQVLTLRPTGEADEDELYVVWPEEHLPETIDPQRITRNVMLHRGILEPNERRTLTAIRSSDVASCQPRGQEPNRKLFARLLMEYERKLAQTR